MWKCVRCARKMCSPGVAAALRTRSAHVFQSSFRYRSTANRKPRALEGACNLYGIWLGALLVE